MAMTECSCGDADSGAVQKSVALIFCERVTKFLVTVQQPRVESHESSLI